VVRVVFKKAASSRLLFVGGATLSGALVGARNGLSGIAIQGRRADFYDIANNNKGGRSVAFAVFLR